MTLEQLTSDIDKLALMTDAELEEHCRSYFTVTRPAMIPKSVSAKALRHLGKGTNKEKRDKLAALQAMMVSKGIDLGALV